jgi:hypothetical protein
MTYTGTSQLYDAQTAKGQRIDSLGAARVEQSYRMVGPRFDATLTGAIWSSPVLQTTFDLFWQYTLGAATGSAAAGQAGNIATFTSGTTANNWVSGRSARVARFVFNNQNMWRALIRTTTVAPGTAASSTTFFGACGINAGAATAGFPTNGYCFAVDGTGAVSVQAHSGNAGTSLGTPRLNISSGFNGTLGSTYTIPDVNFHAYEILYFDASVMFFIDGQLLHKAIPTTLMFSPVMSNPIGFSIVNGASPSSRTIIVSDSTILRFGAVEPKTQSAYIAGATGTLCKTGVGNLQKIIVGTPVNGGTVTVYDNTAASGTILALLTYGSASLGPVSLDINVFFQTGLYVVPSGTQNVTVVFD